MKEGQHRCSSKLALLESAESLIVQHSYVGPFSCAWTGFRGVGVRGRRGMRGKRTSLARHVEHHGEVTSR